MMETEQQIFSLLVAAEDQQKAVQAAIDELAAERGALAQERAAMVQAVAGLAGVVGEVRRAATQAVTASMKESMAVASQAAAQALGEASRPIVGQLSGVVKAASQVEGQLYGAVAAFGWRWTLLAAGAAAGAIVALLLATWLAVWWQRNQVEQLAEKRAELQGEVAQLQTQAGEWTKRAGRVKLEKCGEAGRLCVRVDKGASYGKDGDYFVLMGY